MNKQEKIKSLTWKYFWQQKTCETIVFLLIIFAILFIPYLLGSSVGDNMECKYYSNNNSDSWNINGKMNEETCKLFSGEFRKSGFVLTWFEGLVYLLAISFSLIMIFMIIGGISSVLKSWIQSNWDKASVRAKRDVRRK